MRRIGSHLTFANVVLPIAVAVVGCAVAVPTLTARPEGPIVLGSKNHASNGRGWGKVAPRTISNGGDLSGEIRRIH